MWGNEIYRPEQFGFEHNDRNWHAFYALSNRTPAYAFNDKGYLVPIIETFQRSIGMDICRIDMETNTSLEEIKSITGINLDRDRIAYEVDKWQNRRAYLVLRRFDRFVLGNKKRFRRESEQDKIMQVIRLAEKYGGGTMVAFEGEDWNAVSGVAHQTYELNDFLLDFAALTTIK